MISIGEYKLLTFVNFQVSPKIMATDFKKRIQSLIWSDKIDRMQFDTMWHDLMDEFQLNDNKWLKEMFSIRDRWIPAYFQDVPLSGLMRTTSRSESENSFFGSYLNNNLNLLSFTSSFEAAMEKQRNTQYKNDYECEANNPVLKTRLLIEKHAANVYTYNIFSIVQKEIDDSVWLCSQQSVNKEGDCEVCIVKDERMLSFKKSFEGCENIDADDNDNLQTSVCESEFKVIY